MNIQKMIDETDLLIDGADEESIEKACKMLSTFSKGKYKDVDNSILALRVNLGRYKKNTLLGINEDDLFTRIVIKIKEILDEFKRRFDAQSGFSTLQDKDYDLLCELDFKSSTSSFETLIKSDKRFQSFVIRGPHENHGQRWLVNRLIHIFRRKYPISEPLSINFTDLNLKMDSFYEQFSKDLGVPLTGRSEKIILKYALLDRIRTNSQLVVFYNSYSFIHSSEYSVFRNVIHYFNEELNNAEVEHKCIFFFVEEQMNERYVHIDDCIFSEDKKEEEIMDIRLESNFYFMDLGKTNALKAEDLHDWFSKLSDTQVKCFHRHRTEEDEMAKLLCDGNPKTVIPLICKQIGINYAENEKLWVKILTYTGKALEHGNSSLGLRPYMPSESLKKAVNLTLYLKKRPLLLMGEPGVGKTCLAESVAYELLGPKGMKENYFRWNIKSTSKAKDGLYRYDTFNRLADSQILIKKERDQLNNLKLGAENSYIQRGYLANAFLNSTKEKRSIILIDEIDKADIDFPNDLLNELENYEFTIPETGEEIRRPDNFEYPIVIISSNRERELPPAFLRRCLYHFIEFPDDKILSNIIKCVFGADTNNEIVDKALRAFREKRNNTSDTEKRPSTSEFLDWFEVINHYNRLSTGNPSYITEEDRILIKELELLNDEKIPFAEILLKTYESYMGNKQ